MKIATFPKERAKTTTWSGGTTTEYFVFPFNASYGAKDFQIRISSATVDIEESDFTMLTDYNRIITPLTNQLDLYFEEEDRACLLKPLEMAYFNGAHHTHCKGKATDFNVMTRKGLQATMEKVTATKEIAPCKHRFFFIPAEVNEGKTGHVQLDEEILGQNTLYYLPDEKVSHKLIIKGNIQVLYIIVS